MKNRNFVFYFAAMFCALIAFAAKAEFDMRTWTDSNGRQIIARYAPELAENADDKHVVLISQSGKEIRVLPERLSVEDRQWIAEHKVISGSEIEEDPVSLEPVADHVQKPAVASAPMAMEENNESVTYEPVQPVFTPPPAEPRKRYRRQDMPESLNPAFW